MESKLGDARPLIMETTLDNMVIYWQSCGGDVIELSSDSKKKLKEGEKGEGEDGKQYYYFSEQPLDKSPDGKYEIMDCLGPELNNHKDLFIDKYQGKNYLTKNLI